MQKKKRKKVIKYKALKVKHGHGGEVASKVGYYGVKSTNVIQDQMER